MTIAAALALFLFGGALGAAIAWLAATLRERRAARLARACRTSARENDRVAARARKKRAAREHRSAGQRARGRARLSRNAEARRVRPVARRVAGAHQSARKRDRQPDDADLDAGDRPAQSGIARKMGRDAAPQRRGEGRDAPALRLRRAANRGARRGSRPSGHDREPSRRALRLRRCEGPARCHASRARSRRRSDPQEAGQAARPRAARPR